MPLATSHTIAKTSWTLVEQASADDPRARGAALEQLWRRYEPPLRAFLAAKKHLAGDAVDDLLQQFFARKILEDNVLARADRTRGSRFRSFLLTTLWNFVVSESRRAHAGERVELVEIPEQEAPSADAFDVAWARQVLDETLRRMQAQCGDGKHDGWWELFDCCVTRPLFHGIEAPRYKELTGRFGARSPSQLSNMLGSAKRMYARTLREVVGEDVADPQGIEDEIQDLIRILSTSPA